jgi:hypothetical protein
MAVEMVEEAVEEKGGRPKVNVSECGSFIFCSILY